MVVCVTYRAGTRCACPCEVVYQHWILASLMSLLAIMDMLVDVDVLDI